MYFAEHLLLQPAVNSSCLLSAQEDASKGERGQLRPVTLSRPHELWQPDEKERVLQAGGTVTGGKGNGGLLVAQLGKRAFSQAA